MNKKIFAFFLIFIIPFLLTGCEEEKKEDTRELILTNEEKQNVTTGQKNNIQYFKEIDYETLSNAYKSNDDTFFVLFLNNSETSQIFKKFIDEYSNTNKIPFYYFNIADKVLEVTDDKIKNDKEKTDTYLKNCVNEISVKIKALQEDVKLGYPISDDDQLFLNKYYSEEEINNSCSSEYYMDVYTHTEDELLYQFQLNEFETLVLIDNGLKVGEFKNLVPTLYSLMNDNDKEDSLTVGKGKFNEFMNQVNEQYKILN